MATLQKRDQPADALSRLQIQRMSPSRRSSWLGRAVRTVWIVILLAGLAVGAVYLATKVGWIEPAVFTVPDAIQSRVEVRLATVTVETGRSADATVVATGYLESQRQARIGARAPGRIEQVHVEEGSRVTRNQVLAVLEHADLDASLAAAEASASRARAAVAEHEVAIQSADRDLDRARRLWETKSISEADFDTARFRHEELVARRASLAAELTLAEARVREATQMKENMFIRAPFDGTVISKDAEVGESILPGGMGEASGRGSAVTVADLDHLDVDCDVKEDFISRVAVGQAAEVAVDAAPDFRYRGRVRKIIPMGDRARATIKVKVEIVNVDTRLFPEMSATVYFLPAEPVAEVDAAQRRIFCDAAAVRKDAAGEFVWIADEQDRARRHEVTTGLLRDQRIEIRHGLSGGERVLIAPPEIQPGQLVKLAS